jgi:hypothetical protein
MPRGEIAPPVGTLEIEPHPPPNIPYHHAPMCYVLSRMAWS